MPICPECDTEFIPTSKTNRGRQIYCSQECRLKKWKRKNNDKVLGYSRNYRKNNIEKTNACSLKSMIKRYKELRQEALNLIGIKCLICGSTDRLCFHEIHGKPHLNKKDSTQAELRYYIEHYKDFISLCQKHHSLIHYLNGLTEEQLRTALEYSKAIVNQQIKISV